jgi:uncharacterized protein YgiM (DUF1202 family)
MKIKYPPGYIMWPMRKYPFVLLILLLTLSIPDAFSTADGPDYWRVHGVESNDVLNIRRKANAQSKKIGEIPPGAQCIKNLKCVGGLTFDEFTNLSQAEKDRLIKERPRWCYVGYEGTEGWVAGRYLREGACELN